MSDSKPAFKVGQVWQRGDWRGEDDGPRATIVEVTDTHVTYDYRFNSEDKDRCIVSRPLGTNRFTRLISDPTSDTSDLGELTPEEIQLVLEHRKEQAKEIDINAAVWIRQKADGTCDGPFWLALLAAADWLEHR